MRAFFYAMKKKNWKSNATFGLILFVFFLQIWQSYKFNKALSLFDSLGTDKNQVIEELSNTRSTVREFGNDMNEIRKFLLLPTKDYSFEKEEESVVEEDISGNLFDFVSTLQKSEQDAKMFQDSLTAIKAWILTDVGGGLSVVESEGSVFKFMNSGNSEVAKVILESDGEMKATAFGAIEIYSGDSTEDLISSFKDFVDSDLVGIEKMIQEVQLAKLKLSNEILPSAEVQEVLNLKKIILSGEKEDEMYYYYQISNSAGEMVATLGINKTSACFTLNYDCVADLALAVNDLDARSALEKKVADRKKQIDDLLLDKGFQSTLKKSSIGISFSDESDSRINYKVTNEAGELKYTIFIEKSTGQVMVEKSGGGTSTLLSAIDELRLKKKAPTFMLS